MTIKGNYVQRFDFQQRLQHFILLVSFIVLGATGIPQGFPDAPTMHFWTAIWGGADAMRAVHRYAAWVISLDCVYHLLYVLYGIIVKRTFPWRMMPRIKDVKDFFQDSLYIFGLAEEPVYDHFQYGQKIDYWAIFWGMPVMVITGAIMWWPKIAAAYIPSWGFPMAVTAHRDEAILAVGFILIVHMYYGHLADKAFPINTVFWTGRMKLDEYKQWFYKEYLDLMKKQKRGVSTDQPKEETGEVLAGEK